MTGERAVMVLVNRLDADALLAQLEHIGRPARAGVVNRGAARRSGVHQAFERPTVAALDDDNGGFFGSVLDREGLCRPLLCCMHFLASSLAGKGVMRYVCGIHPPQNECATALSPRVVVSLCGVGTGSFCPFDDPKDFGLWPAGQRAQLDRLRNGAIRYTTPERWNADAEKRRGFAVFQKGIGDWHWSAHCLIAMG
nr:hypothetical protein [Paracoccus siganidrum]